MSDVEDDHLPSGDQGNIERGVSDGEEAERGGNGQSRGKERRRDLEEEEEEEDPEEDEEDEEEEDDVGAERGKKRAKHRHKKPTVNRFLDVEAEVDDDENEDDEDEDYERDEFIAETGADGEEDVNRRAADHARLDRRERELDDQDLAKIAQDLNKRYGRAAVRYTGDMNEVPQRLLMPSVHDASLWQVRVKPGRERDIVFSLMRKAIDLEYTARPLQILSAFQRDSLPGMIYVEARSAQQVNQACNGLVGVYPSRGITLVPIEEMASLLQIKKQDLTVTPGSWVRIRRGKYQGDLAQVMDITENGEDVGLKFIPRIDLNPKDDASVTGGKRKKTTGTSASMRPPQRFFNFEEVIKVYGRKQVSKRSQSYVFQNDTYKYGFIEKDFKLSGLVLENVNPTLDEITRFTKGLDGAENENGVDLSIIAEASRKAAVSVLQPGDHVEVFEGEQSGVHGVVQTINQDVVTITVSGVDIDGQAVDVPARSVRKRFKPGDHVKVMTGQNADETGLVVSVAGNVVTFLSDMSMQEVSVFSKDLREAAEVGSGTNIVGNYELHDLVQLDLQTVGVIFKTERDSFRVLDQNGQVRLVKPHQISMRRDSNRAIATDSEGHELRMNDNVKEIDGEGRKGRVLHIHQSFFAFLHNRDIVENGGIYVTRARSLTSLAPKGNILRPGGGDLSKMNPAMGGGAVGGMVGSGNMGRGPRDRSIGLMVTVVKGPYKGYVGTIKDRNGNLVRTELNTGNKVISLDKDKLKWKDENGVYKDIDEARRGPPRGQGHASMPPPSAFATSSTWGSSTPNAFSDSRTPMWNSSRTPNPYSSDSSRTPAWAPSARTPNPYGDGSKTPAWSASSRTPNPYTSGSRNDGSYGGATPGPNNGGATPKPNASSSAWGTGWETPGRSTGATTDDWSGGWTAAPTPMAAPASAPTPGFSNTAATPDTAPTPAPSGMMFDYTSRYNSDAISAPTPGGALSASTPGVLQQYHTDLDGDWEPPDAWLIDLPNNKNILVEISRTRGGQGKAPWENGEHEGKKAYVNSALGTASSFASTASITVLDTNQTLVVPVEYLLPVQPTTTDELCVGLEGPNRGKLLKVRDVDNSKQFIVSGLQDTYLSDMPPTKLAKLRTE